VDAISAPNMTNREFADAAIAYVIACEEALGRDAMDTRDTGAARDVVSDERVIEVKAYGTSARGQDLWRGVRQVEEARSNLKFWRYVVENVRQGGPGEFRLLPLGGERLQGVLARAVERRTTPFRGRWPSTTILCGEQRDDPSCR
jgi:hypothetical protein